MELRRIVEEAIAEYNKYRSPEANATLLSLSSDEFKVEFRGTFCYTCGFYDYIEDLKVILEEMNLKTKITKIEEVDEGAIATFKIEGT